MEKPAGDWTSWAGHLEPSSLWRRISLLVGANNRCDFSAIGFGDRLAVGIFRRMGRSIAHAVVDIHHRLFRNSPCHRLHGCSRPGSGSRHSGPLLIGWTATHDYVFAGDLALREREFVKRQGARLQPGRLFAARQSISC